MKKTIAISFISILFIVTLSGCCQRIVEPGQDEKERMTVRERMEKTETADGEFLTQSEIDNYLAAMNNEPNMSNCNDLEVVDLKNLCIRKNATDLAIQNNDKSQCNLIEIETRKERCIKRVESKIKNSS